MKHMVRIFENKAIVCPRFHGEGLHIKEKLRRNRLQINSAVCDRSKFVFVGFRPGGEFGVIGSEGDSLGLLPNKVGKIEICRAFHRLPSHLREVFDLVDPGFESHRDLAVFGVLTTRRAKQRNAVRIDVHVRIPPITENRRLSPVAL